MNTFQSDPSPTTKLSKTGCAPRPPATRIIAVPDIVKLENHKTVNAAPDDSPADSATKILETKKPKFPTVKLLGKLKGGMPGERYVLPGVCPKCRTMGKFLQSGEKSHRVLSPQPFKAVGGGSRVANRVGDVSMSEVVLDESGVAAFVG